MSEQNTVTEHSERNTDSKVDMWGSVALVMIAWAVAIFWVSGL
jgi:hypothetical protein